MKDPGVFYDGKHAMYIAERLRATMKLGETRQTNVLSAMAIELCLAVKHPRPETRQVSVLVPSFQMTQNSMANTFVSIYDQMIGSGESVAAQTVMLVGWVCLGDATVMTRAGTKLGARA